MAYQALNNYDLAVKDIERSLKINPTPSAIFNLAILEKENKNYRRCYALLTEIEKSDAAYANVYLQRGLCAKYLNLYDQALSDFIKAASIDGYNPNALENIGIILFKKGDKKNSLKYLEKAGQMYLSQGKIDEYTKIANLILKFNGQ